MQVKMKFEKETAGTVVYREVDAQGHFITQNREGKLPVIYFQKTSEIGQKRPQEITATFEAV